MGAIESPELVSGLQRFEVDEVPNYAKMIARLCGQLGRKESEFSVYRLVMAYPVHGFQYVLAFRALLA